MTPTRAVRIRCAGRSMTITCQKREERTKISTRLGPLLRTITKKKENYSLAIQVYVNATSNVYKSFNAATRTQKESYKTAFKYHSLHFFLANALRILNTFWRRFIKQHFHTYRGTNVTFFSDRKTTM
uniref:NAD(P)(+)--arginine ADP-ribosyltransferase n=1 Tax=Oncorhynchus tshawytscha TaxID=74940 RepID=A0AAZ3PFT5_ONCTS